MGETKVPDPFANFMKVSSIVLSISQSDSGMSVRAPPSKSLSIKSIAAACVNSRFVKYTSKQVSYLRKKMINKSIWYFGHNAC